VFEHGLTDITRFYVGNVIGEPQIYLSCLVFCVSCEAVDVVSQFVVGFIEHYSITVTVTMAVITTVMTAMMVMMMMVVVLIKVRKASCSHNRRLRRRCTARRSSGAGSSQLGRQVSKRCGTRTTSSAATAASAT